VEARIFEKEKLTFGKWFMFMFMFMFMVYVYVYVYVYFLIFDFSKKMETIL